MRIAPILLALLGIAAVAVAVVDRVLRPQTGPLALAAVVEPHLLLVGGIAAAIAVLSVLGSRSGAARWVRLAGVVAIVGAVVVLGGEWWSPPAPSPVPGADRLRVMSWNLELGSKAASTSVEGIAELETDVVALQELTPEVADAITADPKLVSAFPYRILEARAGVSGVGLLSRLPLVVGEVGSDPVVLRAGLLLPDGRRVEVLDAHPFPPDITRVARLPAGLDTRRRDEDLAAIRATVDGLEDPAAALVLGDLNTSPTEPGYATLAAGLHDAHAEVGVGTGFTWRPSSLEVLGLGLLRIDYALSGNLLRPIAISEDCRLPGDHCRLYATLEVAPPGE